MVIFTNFLAALNSLLQTVSEIGTLLQKIVTSLNNLNKAVDGLKLVNKPCGGCGGDQLESEPLPSPGDPNTDPAPEGFEEWSEYDDYKCLAANSLITYWRSFLSNAAIRDWDALAAGGVAIVIDAIGLLLIEAGLVGLGVAITAGPVVVAGLVIGIAVFVIANLALDFSDMVQVIDNNYEDLVCILYSASETTEAKDNLLQAVSDLGYTSVEMGLFSLLVTNYDINKLFYRDEEFASSGYVPSFDCNCVAPVLFTTTFDGGDATPFVVSSAGHLMSNAYRARTSLASGASASSTADRGALQTKIGATVNTLHVESISLRLARIGEDDAKLFQITVRSQASNSMELVYSRSCDTFPQYPTFELVEIPVNLDVDFPQGNITVWMTTLVQKINALGGCWVEDITVHGSYA